MNFKRLKQLVDFIGREFDSSDTIDDISYPSNNCAEFHHAGTHYTLFLAFDSCTDKLVEVDIEHKTSITL